MGNMFTPVNSMAVSDLLYFVYLKLCLLVKDGNEWGTTVRDNGFCSMNNRAGGTNAGRRDKYVYTQSIWWQAAVFSRLRSFDEVSGHRLLAGFPSKLCHMKESVMDFTNSVFGHSAVTVARSELVFSSRCNFNLTLPLWVSYNLKQSLWPVSMLGE